MARTRNLRSRVPKRRMFWVRITNFQEFPGGVPSAADRFNVLSEFEQQYGADLFGFTITRIRGNLAVMYDTTAVVERREFSFGIRKDVQSNTAVSSTNLPSAPSAAHDDWMFTLTDAGQLTNISDWKEYRYPIDIRGQRRMDELSESLFAYVGHSSITNVPLPSGVMQVYVELNVLCKRP